jgi:D-threo-aldose 1-dehydrogenase
MLSSVRLVKINMITSRLAFGTSRLHYVRHGERQRLLACAAELGFVHFDTAPAYGDGLAEAELGRYLQGRRNRFVVATKYGIPPDPIMERWGSYVPCLRIARACARRIGFGQQRMPPFTASGLRESVGRSLQRLKTDWIDILLLHEPRPGRMPDAGEILEQLCKLRQSGQIRAFGLAGAWSGIHDLLAATPELAQVVQTPESEWPESFVPDITYNVISRTTQRRLAPPVDAEVVSDRLRCALLRRPRGVVIVSTTKLANLRALAKAAIELQV